MPREFEAEDSQEDGAPPVCECRFFRKWQFPCSHIWHHHLVFGSLTPSAMEGWVWMWEEGGYELYESRTTEFISRGIKEEIGAPLRKRLDLGEVLTSLRSRYYVMEESVKDLDSQTASNVMTSGWGGSTKSSGPSRISERRRCWLKLPAGSRLPQHMAPTAAMGRAAMGDGLGVV
jgi:hypothetical protein